MASVLVAGHVNWDVTLLTDRLPTDDEEVVVRERHRNGGGSAANVAAGLVGRSVDARLLGSVGDDEQGRRVRAALRDRGVDVGDVRVRPGQTSTKYLLVADGDVAVLGVDGVNEALEPDDVGPETVEDVDHVHLTGQRADTAERLAGLAVDAGCSVSLDPGRRAGDRSLDGVVEHADLVFGTDREVGALFDDVGGDADGRAADGAAAATGAADDSLVVETSGPGGATCYADGAERSHPGFVVDVADTSGAGDAFVAGFLSEWLDDADLERALRVGNACGALASREIGARTELDPASVESVLDAPK